MVDLIRYFTAQQKATESFSSVIDDTILAPLAQGNVPILLGYLPPHAYAVNAYAVVHKAPVGGAGGLEFKLGYNEGNTDLLSTILIKPDSLLGRIGTMNATRHGTGLGLPLYLTVNKKVPAEQFTSVGELDFCVEYVCYRTNDGGYSA